ncbi:MAG TPA: tetratricopeptide repeat protein [Baekduia sp.]|nr:tetratricopeptide repeat protein [Baekduia sp.]
MTVAPKPSALRTVRASEFVRRIRAQAGQLDRHYVLWLGAGCSVSSGIPTAGTLVREVWLPQLHRLRIGAGDLEAWVAGAFPDYDPANAGTHYGIVMDELFPLPEDRQRETERLCSNREPSFGYAVLAALMSRQDGILSTALTTNFDDLIADAMYVFGDRRPLVIEHDALAGFVRPGRVRRPLVVKVHGDHRLNPMHTSHETHELKTSVAVGIRGLLQDRGIIFIGYSGNDDGVIAALRELPDAALPHGIWWVSRDEPDGLIRHWLEARRATWVQAGTFDELMLLFHQEFELKHPTADKFDRMVKNYRDTYETLTDSVNKLPDSEPDSAPLKEAVKRADDAATDWWSVDLEARRHIPHDLDRADEIYRAGVERLGTANLLTEYAGFLITVRGEVEAARTMYERAIAADPANSWALNNYANFLSNYEYSSQAREAYRKALEVSPDDAYTLGSYANFVRQADRDPAASRTLFERALAADQHNSSALAGYASLLSDEFGEHELAYEHFERAIATGPDDFYAFVMFAKFLTDVRHDYDRAEALFKQALDIGPLRNGPPVHAYAHFLVAVRHDAVRAQELFEHALHQTPSNPELLAGYAEFLMTELHDLERARSTYERALAAGHPDEANLSGNLSEILIALGDNVGARSLITRAERLATDDDKQPLRLELAFYALAMQWDERHAAALEALVALIGKGVRSPGWDFSPVLNRAREDGHPDIEWLEHLAAVIAGDEDPTVLEGWADWPSPSSDES